MSDKPSWRATAHTATDALVRTETELGEARAALEEVRRVLESGPAANPVIEEALDVVDAALRAAHPEVDR